MLKELTKQNYKKQTERINQQTWTKGDILAFAKLLNSFSRSSSERCSQILELWNKLEDRISSQTYDITLEQSIFGIDWLRELCFTKSGKNRNNKKVQDFRESDFNIVRNFEKFEFIGFHEVNCGWYCHYSPIYRTIDKCGNYFDYVARMWQAPEIVNRGKLDEKLLKAV